MNIYGLSCVIWQRQAWKGCLCNFPCSCPFKHWVISSIWNFGVTTHRDHLFDDHSFTQFREPINWIDIMWFWYIYTSFIERGKSRNKWPGKINFQTVSILEQQGLLFYFKFLEVQTNEINLRKCMDVWNIFLRAEVHTCQFTATHPSFKYPHTSEILVEFFPPLPLPVDVINRWLQSQKCFYLSVSN